MVLSKAPACAPSLLRKTLYQPPCPFPLTPAGYTIGGSAAAICMQALHAVVCMHGADA